MPLRERTVTAQLSDDLSDPQHRELPDIDYIRACGMVGRRNPLGIALVRLRAEPNAADFLVVIRALREKRPAAKPEQLARVLRHYLVDVCPACYGRGYEVIPDTPHLDENRMCMPCAGSGRLHLPNPTADESYFLSVLESAERRALASVRKRLKIELADEATHVGGGVSLKTPARRN